MRLLLAISFSILASSVAAAQQPAAPAKPFEPVSGQAGKDVVWVPSPPDMVALSRKLAQEAGVADKAQFVEADMYTYDISTATVMALFLLPVNMNRLAPKFFALAPGSRIVANTFGIDGWEPDERVTLPQSSECDSWCEALLWIVPAKIAGTWTTGNGTMTLTQEYQTVQGTVTTGGAPQTVVTGRLRGEELTFIANGMTYKGLAKGNTIEGTITTPSGAVPWTATRR
ncbi:MAG: SAM-dependent methyltransferase [Vicinamibacterales bacterium]